MAKVLFVIRKTKSNTGRFILYCRITAQKITREFSTEEQITQPDRWNQDKQVYELSGQEGEYINLLCDKLKYEIKVLFLNVSGITPDQAVIRLRTPKIENLPVQFYVLDFIKWEKTNLDLKEATLNHHETYLRNLWDFEPQAFFINKVDLAWAERFKLYLKTEKKCLHKTRASRHIEFIKKALDKAIEQKKIKEHGLSWYKQERDKRKTLVYLNEAEVNVLLKANFDIKDLQKALEYFLFQVHTGVSYMDIWATFELRKVKGAGKILLGKRGKTGECFFLPYHPIAELILKKYNYSLPQLDNSTYNKNIKIVAAIVGIKKHLTTHTGRKTFIMTYKNNGWDIRTVQEMAGHSSIRTTERYYMEASPDRLINEMKKNKQHRK